MLSYLFVFATVTLQIDIRHRSMTDLLYAVHKSRLVHIQAFDNIVRDLYASHKHNVRVRCRDFLMFRITKEMKSRNNYCIATSCYILFSFFYHFVVPSATILEITCREVSRRPNVTVLEP
jgi:hypothetical protein